MEFYVVNPISEKFKKQSLQNLLFGTDSSVTTNILNVDNLQRNCCYKFVPYLVDTNFLVHT